MLDSVSVGCGVLERFTTALADQDKARFQLYLIAFSKLDFAETAAHALARDAAPRQML